MCRENCRQVSVKVKDKSIACAFRISNPQCLIWYFYLSKFKVSRRSEHISSDDEPSVTGCHFSVCTYCMYCTILPALYRLQTRVVYQWELPLLNPCTSTEYYSATLSKYLVLLSLIIPELLRSITVSKITYLTVDYHGRCLVLGWVVQSHLSFLFHGFSSGDTEIVVEVLI